MNEKARNCSTNNIHVFIVFPAKLCWKYRTQILSACSFDSAREETYFFFFFRFSFSKRMLIGCTQFNWDMFGLDSVTKIHSPRWIWLHYCRSDASGKWQTTSIVKHVSTSTHIVRTHFVYMLTCRYLSYTHWIQQCHSAQIQIWPIFIFLPHFRKKGPENCHRKAKKKHLVFCFVCIFTSVIVAFGLCLLFWILFGFVILGIWLIFMWKGRVSAMSSHIIPEDIGQRHRHFESVRLHDIHNNNDAIQLFDVLFWNSLTLVPWTRTKHNKQQQKTEKKK